MDKGSTTDDTCHSRARDARHCAPRDPRHTPSGRLTATLESVRWQIHGERELYDSEWVRLTLVDVEIPGGERFEHHVVRIPNQAAGSIVYDPARGVLLLWRHRFITDTWGWEIPAGGLDPGETPAAAAVRETLEETGWQAGPVRPLVHFNPVNGLSDHVFHIFVADGAERVGEPTDVGESERIEWVPVTEVRRIVRDNEMLDGLSLTGVAFAIAFGVFDAAD
jgi:8-oxo-dGTP pyrophosphatase MutT (NUDIX family)